MHRFARRIKIGGLVLRTEVTLKKPVCCCPCLLVGPSLAPSWVVKSEFIYRILLLSQHLHHSFRPSIPTTIIQLPLVVPALLGIKWRCGVKVDCRFGGCRYQSWCRISVAESWLMKQISRMCLGRLCDWRWFRPMQIPVLTVSDLR